MVEQRLLRVAGIAWMELDVRTADLDTGMAVGRRRRRVEAVALVRLRGLSGIAGEERDVVEVVLRVGRRFDEDELHALAEVELRVSLGQLRHPQGDVLERTPLAWPFRVEQGQLASPGVGAHE